MIGMIEEGAAARLERLERVTNRLMHGDITSAHLADDARVALNMILNMSVVERIAEVTEVARDEHVLERWRN